MLQSYWFDVDGKTPLRHAIDSVSMGNRMRLINGVRSAEDSNCVSRGELPPPSLSLSLIAECQFVNRMVVMYVAGVHHVVICSLFLSAPPLVRFFLHLLMRRFHMNRCYEKFGIRIRVVVALR